MSRSVVNVTCADLGINKLLKNKLASTNKINTYHVDFCTRTPTSTNTSNKEHRA